MKLQVIKSKGLFKQRWHTRLVAANGEVLMSSEQYEHKEQAQWLAGYLSTNIKGGAEVEVIDE
jgi:uncharacterized protein YegP (UPF0339 family)